MINKGFWLKIVDNWALDTDGIEIPDDLEKEMQKAMDITGDELMFLDDVSNDEIDDILADLGLDDF